VAAPKSPAWRDHDSSAPLSQGDLLLVAWGKTVSAEEASSSGTSHPVVGVRDAFDLRFWTSSDDVHEKWGRMNYGLAVVLADSCAIDKEFQHPRDEV
jgi:hypothetical protein